ncbi:hypothetical protein [Roseateles sp. L2-2]|uniref:hypothetical protein n=1 Tax=Roseateles sp. L2-2 TaxID=3422597 RepID=UPI003D361061
MRLPPANSAARSEFFGQAIGCVVVACSAFWMLPAENTIALSESDFVPVEGVVTHLETHRPEGRSAGISMSFRLQGHSPIFFSSAVNGVHPSWREGPMVVRTYVPANRKYWVIGDNGVRTYGLWVNGVEQLSLQYAIGANTMSEIGKGSFVLAILAFSGFLGYSAYRTASKHED